MYYKLWPENPFKFVIPYNDKAPYFIKEKFGDNIRFIKTPKSIRETMDVLLSQYDNNTWVYWCIDDKYVTNIKITNHHHCMSMIENIKDKSVCSISLCKTNKTKKGAMFITDKYCGRYNMSDKKQFWAHKFVRIKLLKEFFKNVPKELVLAKSMDNILRKFSTEYKFYTSDYNCISFGESTKGGRATRGFIKSMHKHNIFNHYEIIKSGVVDEIK